MRVPVSWLRDYVALPAELDVAELAGRLTALGLKLEALEPVGADVNGPLVVGRVLSFEDEIHSNGKPVRWCSVDVGHEHTGTGGPRGIVCGAQNFAVGDLVVVALPGAVLPGGIAIGARKTYGHISDGMICSARELGVGDDASGILVLRADEATPGDDATALLHLRDDVIELEITPDRAYALSLRGVAREAAMAYGLPLRDPADVALGASQETGYPVAVDAPDACTRFVTRTVVDIDPSAPTPRWMARRLQLAGMRPINVAVDITNYVMLETGQPIHGYDRARLDGPIRVRRAEPGEKLRTLDGEDRTLEDSDVVIADSHGALGLAGVMGGEASEISAGTSAVVIEAAHFIPVPVARTARSHRLTTEASRRFERGVDPQLPPAAAQRVADLLVAHAGGRAEPGQTDWNETETPAPVVMAPSLPTRVCGFDLDHAVVVTALERVGCDVAAAPNGVELAVTPPTWRPDLQDPYDLVEEVARIAGYDAVPSVLPVAPAGRGLTPAQRLRRRVGHVLAGAGFTEVVAYPFVGPADWDRLGLPAEDPRRHCVLVANALSEARPQLTTTLAPLLLDAVARNVGRGATSVALSLVAPVFLPGTEPRPAAPILPVSRAPAPGELVALDAALPDQPRRLAVALCGNREPSGWWGDGRRALWADALAAVRLVCSALGIDIDAEQAVRMPWHPGRCAAIRLGEAVIGHAGELHPRVGTAWGLPPRTSYAEVDLDVLLAAAPPLAQAPRLSHMPVAKEDVALVVTEDVAAGDVLRALREGAGDLLESVRLFDVYTGDPVPSGAKSLAFSLRLRAPDRTLTEAEAGRARDAAVRAAAAATGARQRT